MTGKENRKTNRLIHEASPYLQQHADNPVDWYPWGPEAFEKARGENKPVFLSIGYSTCHWCHVMEEESFSDSEVARLMNEVFVSIKVDREERPDIDSTYMTVSQMLTGSGGWPLNIIMTPDKKPFFAATYLPKESRFGRIGMIDLVPRVQELWTSRREEVEQSAQEITAILGQATGERGEQDLGEEILERAYEQLSTTFDERYGGFGQAPKFPAPHHLTLLLRYWKRSGQRRALAMVEKTLEAMRLGGVYDHVGFGFHRYSTDFRWFLPHFEKMLYDQAMLAMAHAEAYQATGKELYRRTVEEIFTYVLRDMTSPEGGFYSAEDADSEGEEGKFYLWTEDEMRQILGEEADLVTGVFNTAREGNFREEATGKAMGKNILYLHDSWPRVAAGLGLSEEELSARWEGTRQKLFAAREKRVHPHKDDKILADWNGLMIAALAKGAQALGDPLYAQAAQRAADFILSKMRDAQGRLYHRYREGEAGILGFLDDYAFFTWGLLELYEATFEFRYFQAALDLMQITIEHFWDEEKDSFYLTANDAEEVLLRRKEIYDGAVPSGNSVAMLNLLRLGRMTANPELEKKAVEIGRAFSKTVSQYPAGYTQFLVAVDFALGPAYEVVIAASSLDGDAAAMLQALRRQFIPSKVVLFRPSAGESLEIVRLAEFTKDMMAKDGKATAYVCRNYQCHLPTTDVSKMLELLQVPTE